MPEADDVANELHTQIQYRLIEKLSESERRYRELVEGLREIVFKCDRLGQVTFLNRALTTTLGYSVAEVMGKPLDNFMDPLDRSLWQEILATLPTQINSQINSQVNPQINISQELRFIHQNGTVVWLELYMQSSRAVELSGSLVNITDRKRAEISLLQINEELEAKIAERTAALTQANQDLTVTLQKLQYTQSQMIQREKMSSLGQLVAGVAHEINNPVNFIYGNIQPAVNYVDELIEVIHLYQAHYPHPPQSISRFLEEINLEYIIHDFSQLLASMKNGATRIRDIIKSLRTFSRLDEVGCKAINMHENLESTLVILQSRLNGRDGKPEIQLIRDYGDLPPVECYVGLLNQVFVNLLMNAIDAIEQHQNSLEPAQRCNYKGMITIATSVINSTNQAVISIRDNGAGMSPQVQEKIFNPFFTTKPVGKGTGMGLAISYQIMEEKHQGNISVNSTPDQGTEFVITLPIKQVSVAIINPNLVSPL